METHESHSGLRQRRGTVEGVSTATTAAAVTATTSSSPANTANNDTNNGSLRPSEEVDAEVETEGEGDIGSDADEAAGESIGTGIAEVPQARPRPEPQRESEPPPPASAFPASVTADRARCENTTEEGQPAPAPGPGPAPAPLEGVAAGRLTAELARRVVANFPACCAGQFMSSHLSERRFLSCLGVHRSMAVFAYAPGRPGHDPRGFAAQPTTGSIRFSLERRGEFLPEVARAMSKVFKGIDKGAVSIHIVGDLVGEPLQRYMQDMPAFTHCCSLHLEAALSKAGFKNIDKTFCAAFEEEQLPSHEGDPRPTACAVGDGRRFSLAALDLKTGQVIVQSSGTRADVKAAVQQEWPAIEEEYERDKALQLERNMVAPMVDANATFGDSWALYYEVVAHPLPTLLAGLMVVATLGVFGVKLLPESPAPFDRP